MLGLSATISNRPYEVTAEMIEPGQANFITWDALLHFLRQHGEVALRVAEKLSRNYYTAYEGIRTLGLTNSPSERFAKLLLGWSNAPHNGDPLHVKLTLTREEIGEIIGTTRETVSRLLSQFKRKHLVQFKGANLMYPQQSRPGSNGQLLTTGTSGSGFRLFQHATIRYPSCVFDIACRLLFFLGRRARFSESLLLKR